MEYVISIFHVGLCIFYVGITYWRLFWRTFAIFDSLKRVGGGGEKARKWLENHFLWLLLFWAFWASLFRDSRTAESG